MKDHLIVDISNDDPINQNKYKNNNASESFAHISTKDMRVKSANLNNSNNNQSNIQNSVGDISTKPQNTTSNNINNTQNDLTGDNINTNRIITDEEVSSSSKLKLEEIEGNLFGKKTVEINAAGLIGGRNVKDGVAIFGKSANNNFKCDYELNYEGLNEYPFIFTVYYLRETKSYYIRSCSGKSICNRLLFIRLSSDYEMPIKQREIISIGNNLFQLFPSKENCIEVTNLQKEESDNQKKTFDKTTQPKILIGRDQKCDFSFPNEKSYSRIQCTIEYISNKKEWVVYDGTKGKQSTNGTWVFALHSFPIIDQMIIEVLSSKLRFSVI